MVMVRTKKIYKSKSPAQFAKLFLLSETDGERGGRGGKMGQGRGKEGEGEAETETEKLIENHEL